MYIVSALDAEKGPLRILASVPVIHQSTPWITYAPLIVLSGGCQSANVADQIRRGAGGGRRTRVWMSGAVRRRRASPAAWPLGSEFQQVVPVATGRTCIKMHHSRYACGNEERKSSNARSTSSGCG